MDEHVCLIPDENDNCIDCGKRIDLSDVGEPPDLGDIVGICKLIDATAASFVRAVRDNTDPKDPSLTRLRIVGNRIMRLSHKTILRQMIQAPFKQAKALGFRGDVERFAEHIEERMSPSTRPLFPEL